MKKAGCRTALSFVFLCFFTIQMGLPLYGQSLYKLLPSKPAGKQQEVPVPREPEPADQKTAEEVPLDMQFVFSARFSGGEAESFIIGGGAQSYTAERTVLPFYIGRCEVSYRLWYDVRMRAETIGYIFYNRGQAGSGGRYGRRYTEENRFQPVTNISWYDAIVWCNALSELTGRTPCYTYKGQVLRDSSETVAGDLAVCSWEADGFRLPSEAEWEYAARRTADGFQTGAEPSGVVSESVSKDDVSWYDGNTSSSMTIATAGAGNGAEMGDGNPNGLGLYDMSGNVLEYCWDWFDEYADADDAPRYAGPATGSERVCRGGSWSPYASFLQAGDRYSYDPNTYYNYMGFRIVSSAEPDINFADQ